jgi:hypothetical protein
MRKTTLLTISLAFLGILPAMAQLGNVWTDFQYYAVDLQNYLKYNVPETLKPTEYESQNAIDYATGEVNIPNPIAATKRLREDIVQKSLSSTFENNPAVQATTASNEINRQISRGAVESTLGEEGQKRLKAKLQNVENSIKNIEQSVRNAEQSKDLLTQVIQNACQVGGENIAYCASQTQANLQLQNLIIEGEQSKMIGETLGNTIQLNQSLQYSNLNLANISQQVEEENRARRVDTSAEAARLLRATSQVDLLGRGINNE